MEKKKQIFQVHEALGILLTPESQLTFCWEEQLFPCGVQINSGQLSDNLSFGCSRNNCVYSKYRDSTAGEALKLSSLSAINYTLWKASLSFRLKRQVIELHTVLKMFLFLLC